MHQGWGAGAGAGSQSWSWEPELELGARELGARVLGFFEGAGALFSDVSGAGAGAIKIFGSSSFYPIIEKM